MWIESIALDGDTLLAVGNFRGSLTVGDQQLASAGSTDCFVIAVDARNGAVKRGLRLGGEGEELCRAIAVGADGIYLSGAFSERVALGATTLISRGSHDVFVARLTRALSVEWATQLGGPNNDLARGLGVDGQRGVIAVGTFGGDVASGNGSADLGAGPVATAGDFDAFVAALDSAGRTRWAHRLGNSGFDVAKAVRVDASGEVYVVGSLDKSVAPRSPDDWQLEGFAARFSSDGQQRWLREYAGVISLHALTLDPRGGIDVVGHFRGAGGLGGCHLTSAGGSDVFAARLSPAGDCVTATRRGGIANDYGYAIDASSDRIAAGGMLGSTSAQTNTTTGFLTLLPILSRR
jgi:hypothetical protein